MRDTRLTATRLAAIAVGVLALHVLLLGDVAQHTAAIAPHTATPAAREAAVVVALRTLHLGKGERNDARDEVADARTDSDDVVQRATADAARQPVKPRSTKPASASSLPRQSPERDAGHVSPVVNAPPQTPAVTDDGQSDVPTYPTLPPPAFAHTYTLQRGAAISAVEWRWQPQAGHYESRLESREGDTRRLTWRSVGSFDAAGLAPLRYTDRQHGRGMLAANFQRDAGRITFSGPQIEHALAAGTQDGLSWLLQLAAIAAADPARVAAGGGVTMRVVGVRGGADVWTFEPLGTELIDLPEGATPTVHLLRAPQRAYDTRAEVWLDPARHYLPVRVRRSNGATTTELRWQGGLPTP